MNKEKLLYALFFLLLILGILFRLYKFNNPLDGIHSWRQADTSSVSRNYGEKGINLLQPRFDDLSNVPSGLDNPEGYRYVEFPIYNSLQAGMRTLFPFLTLEQWGRLITIVSSVLTAVFLYLLVKKYFDHLAALCVFGVFLFLPYSFYYGRVLLADPTTSMTILGAIYFFDLWASLIGKKWAVILLLVSFIFAASSLLLKPFAAFFLLPLVWLSFQTFGKRTFLRVELYLYAFLAVIPLIAWRMWITQHPEGIPASDWLFNGGDIRFTGAYFYWIFAKRIGELILGYWGVALLVLGVLYTSVKSYKISGLFYSFLVGCSLYLIIIARGNVQHDYYQILILPTLALFTGLGIRFLLSSKVGNQLVSIPLAGVLILFMLSFGWYAVKGYYQYDNTLEQAGREIDALLPKEALVVTPRDGDMTFLYYMNRRGWSSFAHPLPDLVTQGADYLVIAYPKDEDREIGKIYPIIHDSEAYLLFDLRKSL